MGYEIDILFFEKEDGAEDFDKDESKLKTRTIKIGQPDELVPLEQVAATALREYTKRDIWIHKIDVSEWTKKPLKFAQTKSGVKIGTQSFNLGLNEIMKFAVDDRPQRQAPPPQYQQQPQPQYQQPQYQQQPHSIS